MQLDELSQGEPEFRALRFLLRPTDLPELLEHGALILEGDTLSVRGFGNSPSSRHMMNVVAGGKDFRGQQ